MECKLLKHRIFKWKIEIKMSMINKKKKSLEWIQWLTIHTPKCHINNNKKKTILKSQNRAIEQIYDG